MTPTVGARDDPPSLGFLNRLLGREPQAGRAPLERTLPVCTVRAGALVATVGESYRQEALRGVARAVTDAGPVLGDLCEYALEVAETEPERRWFRAVLVPEPENEQDPNAIAVYAEGGRHVACLSREHAAAYRQVFASLLKRGYSGAAGPAMLTGGGPKSYGVVLALSSPGHLMGDLHAEEHAADRAQRARAKDERGRAIYEAAVAGEPWEAIAAAHNYETASGAYGAARAYAKRHGLELPRRATRRRGRAENQF